jgi:hypothetical protein
VFQAPHIKFVYLKSVAHWTKSYAQGKWVPVVQEDGSTGVDFEVARDGTENNWLQ